MKLDFVLWIISALILASSQVYVWHNIAGQEFNIKNIKEVIIMIAFTIIMIVFNSINLYIKPIVLIIITLILCKIVIKEKIRNCIIIVFLNYFLILIAEAIFGLSILALSKSSLDYSLDKYSGGIIANIIISILICVFSNTKIISKLYKFIVKHTSNLKEYQIMIFLLIIISASASTFLLTYYGKSVIFSMILNTIITIVYAIVIILIIKTKNKNNIITSKYNTSLNNLQAQESIINEYRVMNHENKNNLLTIKGMTSNTKVIGYIDSLLKQKNNMNNKIINDTLKLPEGGIRGLIYSKMLVMKDNNIKCNLNVDKRITVKTLANINDSDIVDICQVLGVFIDNAIEESVTNEKQEINLGLHLTKEQLIITISNYHNKNFDKNSQSVFIKSTKGKGHGYGLQLVKRIVNDNKRLNNTREITKDTFTQKLEITI